MVANILPTDPIPDPEGVDQKVKIQLFQNMVMLHIKLNKIMNAANMVANILPTDPNPDPEGGFKCQNQFFQNMVMLHIILKGMTHTATREQIYFTRRPPTRALWGLVKRSKIVSEYDQEIPQSQTADNPVAPRREPLNHHETPGTRIKQSNQLSLPHQDDCNTRLDIK